MSPFEVSLNLATGIQVTPDVALSSLFNNHESDRLTRIRLRNQALNDASEILKIHCGSAWQLAGMLEKAVTRFDAIIWPRFKLGINSELGPVDEKLLRAFLCGEKIPTSQRWFYDTLLKR